METPRAHAVTNNISIMPGQAEHVHASRIAAGDLVPVCWHCVHPPPEGGALEGIPNAGVYYTNDEASIGQFCSYACMLAYTLERPCYRNPILRAAINHLAYTRDGVQVVIAAPSQNQLDIFGGPFTLEQFRAQAGAHRLVRRVAPPFVSSNAVTEVYNLQAAPAGAPEAVPAPAVPSAAACGDAPGPETGSEDQRILSQLDEWGLTGLRRPATQPDDLLEACERPARSVYGEYVQRHELPPEEAPAPAEAAAHRAPRQPAEPAPARPAAGSLKRFFRPT